MLSYLLLKRAVKLINQRSLTEYGFTFLFLSKINPLTQRYFIELAYKGTHFHGWQVQPNAVSVQESLEKALSTITRETIAVTGAGRTDTGVHASYYVAHFDSLKLNLNHPDFTHKLNSFLGNDLVIFSISKVNSIAHAGLMPFREPINTI